MAKVRSWAGLDVAQRLSAEGGLCSYPPRTRAPRVAGLAVL